MAGETASVSCVIVNWNTRQLLLDCIRSVIDGAGDLSLEVIVVDNASADGSAEAVRELFPRVQLIPNDTNVGFGRANNIAMAAATGKYILLLNPDTVVPAGEIEKLMSFLVAHPEVGAVGPLLVGEDGKPQVSSFGLYPSPLEAAVHGLRIWRLAPRSGLAKRFFVRPEGPQTWTYTRHLLGACLLLRREVVEQTGGFDEDFFLFLEETDLCCRIRLAGWEIAYTTDASITHVGEQSMQDILHKTGGLYIRSYNLFCRKHGHGLGSRLLANMCLIGGIFVDTGVAVVKWRSLGRALRSLQALAYGYIIRPV